MIKALPAFPSAILPAALSTSLLACLASCGTDASDTTTVVVQDMGPPPPPATFAACERSDIVIAALDVATGTLTLLNPTASEVVIDSSSAYQLCQGPGRYSRIPVDAPVTIASGATADFDISDIATIDIRENGTLSIYAGSAFESRDSMIDWVCWGDGDGSPRLGLAQRRGSDGSVLWDDAGCIALGSETTFFRIASSDGSSAGDYTTSDPSISCE